MKISHCLKQKLFMPRIVAYRGSQKKTRFAAF